MAKKKAKNTSKSYALTIAAGSASVISLLSAGMNFLANIVIARLYGEEVFGQYSYLFSLLTVVAITTTIGVGQLLLITLPNANTHRARELVGSANGTIGLVLLAISGPMTIYLISQDFTKTEALIFVVSLTLLSSSFVRQALYFSSENIVVFQLWDKLARVCIFLSLVFIFNQIFNAGLKSVLFALLISLFIPAVILTTRKHAVKTGLNTISSVLPKADLLQSSKLYAVLLLTTILANMDILILGYWGYVTDVAHFSAAQKLALVGSTVLMSITHVVTPKLVKAERDDENFSHYIRYSTVVGFFSIACFAVLMMMVGRYVLMLFGENFSGAQDVLVILVLSTLISSAFGQTLTLMKVKGESGSATIYLAIAVLMKLATIGLFFQMYGIIGVAVTTGFSILLWNVLCWAHLYSKYRLNPTIFGVIK